MLITFIICTLSLPSYPLSHPPTPLSLSPLLTHPPTLSPPNTPSHTPSHSLTHTPQHPSHTPLLTHSRYEQDKKLGYQKARMWFPTKGIAVDAPIIPKVPFTSSYHVISCHIPSCHIIYHITYHPVISYHNILSQLLSLSYSLGP